MQKKQQSNGSDEVPPQVSYKRDQHENNYAIILFQVHQIANCLETGIFEALEKQYLRAVVIAFQHGSTPDAPLLEAYTLKFHYSSEGEVSMILADLEDEATGKISSSHRAEAVVRAPKKALLPILHLTLLLPSQAYTKGIKAQASQMLRNVITMVHTLRPLPDQCVVSCFVALLSDGATSV